MGYLAAWRSDRRRFQHERELKSGDDLVARLDDVQVALEKLGESCAEMRNRALAWGGDPDKVAPSLQAAEDAYQDARALIARLNMRPFADRRVVEQAREAAGEMMVGIRLVRQAVMAHGFPALPESISTEVLAGIGQVPDAIDRGYAAAEQYEALAREAVGKLLGRPREIDLS